MDPRAVEWIARRKREKRWEHNLDRYTTIGRKADHLRAVWDASKGRRVSRWLTSENAERVARDCNRESGVIGWVYRIGEAEDKDRASSTAVGAGRKGRAG